MDNFMDKLSKRFNAGEIIQANGEAEAKESARMKQQISEYEKIIQDVRRMSLKTAEMSEQASQLLASGIEQFEAYENQRLQMELRMDEILSVNESACETMEAFGDTVQKLQDLSMDDLDSRLSGITLRIDNTEEILKREIADAFYRMEASISELRQRVLKSGEQGQQTDAFVAKLDAALDRLTAAQDGEWKRFADAQGGEMRRFSDVQEEMLKGAVGAQENALKQFAAAQEDTLQKFTDAQEEGTRQITLAQEENFRKLGDRIEEKIGQLTDAQGEELRKIGAQQEDRFRQSDGLQDEIRRLGNAMEGYRQLSEIQDEQIKKLGEKQEEAFRQTKEMIVNLRLYLDEVQKNIEDFVHKEDVKVYRNVQANFAEQMTNRFRDVGDQLGSLDRDVSRNSGSKKLLIVTFLMAAASVALQVLQMLGILG